MSRTKKEFKYFTIAQYEQEQDYLSEMHRNGWKLVKITYPGFYFFEECGKVYLTIMSKKNGKGFINLKK